MRKTFSNILKAAALCFAMTLTFTACGSKEQTTPQEDTAQVEDTDSETESSETESGTRIINTEKGEVEIPANPQRIADVSGISDILYILDEKPVATADSDAYDYTKFPVYLEEELKGATIVGYPMMDTVDVEGILAADPDLIIINPRQEKAYEQLSAITTTIVINPDVNDWRSDMRLVANIFEKESIAEDFIQTYDEKTKAIGEEIKAANGEDTTYFSFLTSGSDFYLFTGAAFGDILYNDMGLGIPENLPEQDSITLPVASLEGITEIDADYMIVLASDEDRAALESSSVWNSLRAVKDGNVIWLTQSPYFNQAYSSYGKNKLVDEMKDLLIK